MDKLSTNVRKNISPSVAYLSLAGGDEDVHCVDLVKLKVELVVLLPLRLRWVLNNGKRFVVLFWASHFQIREIIESEMLKLLAWIMVFSPSMWFCSNWWESMPSIGLQS